MPTGLEGGGMGNTDFFQAPRTFSLLRESLEILQNTT